MLAASVSGGESYAREMSGVDSCYESVSYVPLQNRGQRTALMRCDLMGVTADGPWADSPAAASQATRIFLSRMADFSTASN